MLDTDGALDFLKRMHDNASAVTVGSDDNQESKVESQTTESLIDNESPDAAGNAEPSNDADKQTDLGADAEGETADAKVDDGANHSNETDKPKRKFTKQEKYDYAFAAERRKRKDLQAKYDKQIAELEERLKRYEKLTEDDYGSDKAAFINHLLDQRDERNQLAQLRKDKADADYQANLDEAMEQHAIRMDKCFADQAEKDRYINLLQNGASKFRECLNEHDPDGIVNSYLSDSELQPLMTRLLMTNPAALKKVLDHKNPTLKMFELRAIENQLQMQRRIAEKMRTKEQTKLPVLGSQVKNMGGNGSGKRDWNAYLRDYPHA